MLVEILCQHNNGQDRVISHNLTAQSLVGTWGDKELNVGNCQGLRSTGSFYKQINKGEVQYRHVVVHKRC